MSDLRDTIINIEIFAFIGLLLWLYFRPSHLETSQRAEARDATNTSAPADGSGTPGTP